MLKQLLFHSFVLLFANIGVSQTSQEKVKAFLGFERFEEYQGSNPGLISFLIVKVEEGYKISESIPLKKDSYEQINQVFFKKSEIPLASFLDALEREDFNILNYSFPNQDSNRTYHYLIGDSDVILTIYSNSFLNKKVASK